MSKWLDHALANTTTSSNSNSNASIITTSIMLSLCLLMCGGFMIYLQCKGSDRIEPVDAMGHEMKQVDFIQEAKADEAPLGGNVALDVESF